MLIKRFFEDAAQLAAKLAFVWPRFLKRYARIIMWKYPKTVLVSMISILVVGFLMLLWQRERKGEHNPKQLSATHKKDSLVKKSTNAFNFSKGIQEIWTMKKMEQTLNELMQKDTLDHQDSILLKKIDLELNKKLNGKN